MMTRRMTAMLMALAAPLALLALIWMFQRRLMYFPMGEVPPLEAIDLEQVEPVAFPTTDGLTLHGWFFPSAVRPAFTILVCNGNAGNRSFRAPLALALRSRGFSVLLFDYRGFGGNAGSPSERGLAADVRAARSYLLQRPDVGASQLVYFGESLGAAVVTELAAAYPPAALVLRSPFTSMTEVGSLHYPFLPVRWLLRDRYPTIDRIAHLRAPMVVIAGDRDAVVPLDQSRRVYEAAGSTDKRLVVIPGADHNDESLLSGEVLVGTIVELLQKVAQASR